MRLRLGMWFSICYSMLIHIWVIFLQLLVFWFFGEQANMILPLWQQTQPPYPLPHTTHPPLKILRARRPSSSGRRRITTTPRASTYPHNMESRNRSQCLRAADHGGDTGYACLDTAEGI
ncbi:hypothetical protein ACMFMF_001379 [Clarireedia jacksonii]